MTKTLTLAAGAMLLMAAGAGPAQAETSSNGIYLNGITLNGITLNALSFNALPATGDRRLGLPALARQAIGVRAKHQDATRFQPQSEATNQASTVKE